MHININPTERFSLVSSHLTVILSSSLPVQSCVYKPLPVRFANSIRYGDAGYAGLARSNSWPADIERCEAHHHADTDTRKLWRHQDQRGSGDGDGHGNAIDGAAKRRRTVAISSGKPSPNPGTTMQLVLMAATGAQCAWTIASAAKSLKVPVF